MPSCASARPRRGGRVSTVASRFASSSVAIRTGAARFLADRGVVRSEVDLPIWQIEEPGARIVLVAHAGTNSVTIGHLLGLQATPWEWDRFVLGHTSISRIEAMPLHDGYTFCLSKLSDVEHLADRRPHSLSAIRDGWATAAGFPSYPGAGTRSAWLVPSGQDRSASVW